MRELIYCVEILKQRHELLRKDRNYFFGLQDYEKCAFIRDLEKQVEVVVEKLLKDCKIQMNTSTTEGLTELKANYEALISYFNLDYEKRKKRLEYQLEEQKKSLNCMMVIFNFRQANKIRESIRQTEKELKILCEQIRKSDSL